MLARKALLRRLATTNDWEGASRAWFTGESWLETRNTIYRFQDGICIGAAGRTRQKTAQAATLLGMRLIGWIAGEGTRFTGVWEEGACAVLWRPGGAQKEESMAMTSATVSFARGRSPAHLQALHDHAPPGESKAFRRREGAPYEPVRPSLPSSSSYRSG
jgi:hypothetical protein